MTQKREREQLLLILFRTVQRKWKMQKTKKINYIRKYRKILSLSIIVLLVIFTTAVPGVVEIRTNRKIQKAVQR